MKYIDGFDTTNAEATTPEGYAIVALYPTETKFTAVMMRNCGDAKVIRAYDENGGIACFSIPRECMDAISGDYQYGVKCVWKDRYKQEPTVDVASNRDSAERGVRWRTESRKRMKDNDYPWKSVSLVRRKIGEWEDVK